MTNLKENYKTKVKDYQPKPPYVWNCVKAFLIGGLICLIGQALQDFYIHFLILMKNSGQPDVRHSYFNFRPLTGFGIYDRLGQFAGAGSAVPVTGFANSMTSAALEHRSEGLVLGVATNMFKLAGNVIVFGVVAAYIVY